MTKSVTRGSQTTSVTYGYDAKGQLLTVTPEGEPTRTNEYDANGNRLCSYEAPATDCDDPAVFDAQDRLLSYDGVEYLYTDRGSLFQRDDGSSDSTIDYVIDGHGRRIGK